ncbi:MFS transporter [Amycolatopsis keratiniphila]|uniref:Major facilitator superfamily protein n=1 Tax=Amycolatopsis keratiniphila TaxID=129921 RepID=R4TAR4_9PSEU|nr:MFS transporter [Amycolatopsis keratiniphila]AGM07902.1 major facilitator superfamily protein [Amycolatopsis keratiniphila]
MQSLFAHPRDFRKLWIGQTISAFGDKASRVALPTVALLSLGGTAWDVGVLAALRFLPFVLLGSVVGVWVDRTSRRKIMIWADVGRLLAMGYVPLAYLLDILTLGQLFVVAGVVGTLTVFFEVAAQSYIPALAGPDGIVAANERMQTSRAVAEVGGAAAAGGLMQFLGNALAILADALSFLASLISLLLMRHREDPAPAQDKPRSALREAREGLAMLMADPRLRNLMFATTTVNLGVASGAAIMLVFAYDYGKLSPGVVGLAFAVGTVGLILGAITSGAISRKLTVGRTLTLAILLTGLSYLLLPIGGRDAALVTMLVCQFLTGFADSVFNIHTLSLVQRITPPEMMGRVNGTALSVVWGTGTLGGLTGGLIGTVFGTLPGLVVAAAIICCGAVFVIASPLRAIRDGAHEPMANAVG